MRGASFRNRYRFVGFLLGQTFVVNLIEHDVRENGAVFLHGDPDDVIELGIFDAADFAATARGR
jgi:hypothetical protein